jgi:hypothetical protein
MQYVPALVVGLYGAISLFLIAWAAHQIRRKQGTLGNDRWMFTAAVLNRTALLLCALLLYLVYLDVQTILLTVIVFAGMVALLSIVIRVWDAFWGPAITGKGQRPAKR